MLTHDRAPKKSNRKPASKSGSSYQAVVHTVPAFRTGGRRSGAERPAGSTQTSKAGAQTTRRAKTAASPSRRFSLSVQFDRWRDWTAGVFAPRAKNRRSRARLGQPRRELPNLHTTILDPLRSLWETVGNTTINILFLALVGWVLFWFFANEQFYVSEIGVTGNQRVSAEAIVAASGLRNYSIFWLNPQEVGRQVTASLPPVRTVQVKYGLPNRVTLIVEEQGGQVMWQIAGANYWVDDDGRLHPAQGDATPSIIVQDIRPGLPDSVDPEAVQAAQQLIELLPGIESLGYAPTTGLRFNHARGWLVYLGVGSDMARKVNILRAIEQQFGQDAAQPSLVDLRFPDSPYYRLPDGNGA